MSRYKLHIRPYGAHTLLLEWPEEVDTAILDDMLRLRSLLREKGYQTPDWDIVPAYRSMAIISNKEPFDPDTLKAEILKLYRTDGADKKVVRHLWHLPVCYDESFGSDLEEMTQFLGLSREELIAQHTAQPYGYHSRLLF